MSLFEGINQRISAQEHAAKTSRGCYPLRIIVENYLEGATIDVTPAPYPTLPASNLIVPERESVMMTQSRTEHAITGNFDRRRVVNAFVLYAHTLSAYGKMRLELFADDDQSGVINYDSGLIYARRRIPLQLLRIGVDPWGAVYGDDLTAASPLWFNSVFAKSYRVTLYDQPSTKLPNYITAQMMMIGRYWSPETNFSWNPTIQWVQEVQHSRSEGKTLHSEGTQEKYRRVSFNLEWLSEDDATLLYEFIRQYGGLKEFYVSMYPHYRYEIREIEHSLMMRFTGELPPRTHTHPHTYSVPIEGEEI